MKKIISLLVSIVLLTGIFTVISTAPLAAKEDPSVTSKLEAACMKHQRSPIIPIDFLSSTISGGRHMYTCRDLSGVDDEDERYFKIACKSLPGYFWVTHGAEDSLHTGTCIQK